MANYTKLNTPDKKVAYVSQDNPEHDKQISRISLEWESTPNTEKESLNTDYTFPVQPFTKLTLATSAGESEVYINKNSTDHDEIVKSLLEQYQTAAEALYTIDSEHILEISTKMVVI